MNPIQIALAVYVSCKAEIAHLQLIRFRIDEQILRLDVPMHDVLRVEVVDGLQDLVNE